jgi:hypothetical protein
MVMAYAVWLFVKRVGDSKQSRSSRKRGELLADASVRISLAALVDRLRCFGFY